MAKWFYAIDGRPAGPVDSAALKQFATTGRLKPTDKVRREDLAEWYEAKQVKGLFAPEQSQPMASLKTAATTAVQPQSILPTANVKRDGAKSVTTPVATPASATARTTASASTADPLASTSNPPEKKKVKTKDAVLGCGCVTVLMVLLLPAIHAAREAARKNATLAAASDRATTSPNNLSASRTGMRSRISFKSDDLAATAAWAYARCNELAQVEASGNQLVAGELKASIADEVQQVTGTEIKWNLYVDGVTATQITFSDCGEVLYPTGAMKRDDPFFDVIGAGQNSLGNVRPLTIALGQNIDFARTLKRGSTIPMRGNVKKIALSKERCEITLDNLTFAER
jgi:hypothetical protein